MAPAQPSDQRAGQHSPQRVHRRPQSLKKRFSKRQKRQTIFMAFVLVACMVVSYLLGR